jgi:hypothetical protein
MFGGEHQVARSARPTGRTHRINDMKLVEHTRRLDNNGGYSSCVASWKGCMGDQLATWRVPLTLSLSSHLMYYVGFCAVR